MKKLILILLLLCSMTTNAQTIVRTHSVEVGKWNETLDNWVWFAPMKCDLSFTLKESLVTVDDEAGSMYMTSKIIFEDDQFIHWEAVDEKLIECVFSMSKEPGVFLIVVTYDKICYRYEYY